MKFKKIFFYSFLILYLELIYKILVHKNIFNINLLYTLLFSIPIILLLTLLSSLGNKKVNTIITYINTSILSIYFIFQYIFYTLFSLPFSFQTIALANQALDFTNIIIDSLIGNILALILFLLPIILLILVRKKISFEKKKTKINFIYILLIFIIYLLSLGSLHFNKKDIYSVYNLYHNIKEEHKTIYNFGLLTATRLDIKRTIFGFNEKIILDTNQDIENENQEVIEEVKYNVTDINFEQLINENNDQNIKNLLSYFNNQSPTNQNDYTGYFEGKNLIFILAEGFNSIAVDEILTPTLYKLTNNGFVFNNFYSPLFLSTTGGEFQATTGLIPTQEILKLWKGTTPNIYYALGNSFNRLNYTTNAYHNWTYSYYERNKTMKTLGFNSYLGCRNGLEKEINCRWLPSDLEMINVTYPKYSNNEKFMTYYISVSGHAPYNFTGGNRMATKHKEYVQDLPYSTPVKAYLASQIEFDRALESLINQLETQGILDDTVIAFVGDHYPYTLTMDEINQISNYERDEIIEVNKSNLVIWNNAMEEKVEVNKVGSQIDVLPTLLNLFGITYDSRLIVGHDILSDTDGLAIFSNRSWVSDKGTYFASSKKFVPKDEITVEEDYVNNINTKVANNFTISNSIIKYNIYNKIFK